jgi:hypothetical protein
MGAGLKRKDTTVVYPPSLGRMGRDHELSIEPRLPVVRPPEALWDMGNLITTEMVEMRPRLEHQPNDQDAVAEAVLRYYTLAEDRMDEISYTSRLRLLNLTNGIGSTDTLFAPSLRVARSSNQLWVGLVGHDVIDGVVVFRTTFRPVELSSGPEG